MRYLQLGRSGLRVSEACLGAMTFGAVDWGASLEESRRIFDAYREVGGNFIDTANNYAGGRSEEIVGELLAADRDRFVLATKYTAPIRPGDVNAFGNHRKSLVQSLDQSLRRLRTDYVDLLWVHLWDAVTPIAELMRSLDDQIRAGKVLYVGISDVPAWAVAEGNTLARERGWTPFSAIQIEYSLVERTVEHELMPMAEALGLGVLPWSPLGGGILTGKYTRADLSDENGADVAATRKGVIASTGQGVREGEHGRLAEGDRRLTERNLQIAGLVSEIGERLGAPPAQVALAWLRNRGEFVVPIVGARSAEQLEASLGYLELELDDDDRQTLDEASAVPMGFPDEMLARFGVGRPASA